MPIIQEDESLIVATTFASQALQAGGRIMAAYPKFNFKVEPGSQEHLARQDLEAIRLVVGAWCSRNPVDRVQFHKARAAILRWGSAGFGG